MKLNYKASNIAKAESASKVDDKGKMIEGKKFFIALSGLGDGLSVDDLLFLFTAGGGTEDEFDELFSKGVQEVIVVIMEGISDAGFLGKKVDTAEIRKALAEAQKVNDLAEEEIARRKATPSTGDKTKA